MSIRKFFLRYFLVALGYLLFFLSSPLWGQQSLSKGAVYLNQDQALEKKIDQALRQQISQDLLEATERYLKVLRRNSSSVMKYRVLKTQEMGDLLKIIQSYQKQQFEFQKNSKEGIGEQFYLEEIFQKFPPTLVSLNDLQNLSQSYKDKNFSSLWEYYGDRWAPGYYIGINTYVRKLLRDLPSQVAKEENMTRINHEKLFRNVWNQGETEDLAEKTFRYPLWSKRKQALNLLGEYHFFSGNMDLAIGYWQELLFSLDAEKKRERASVIAKLASAIYQNGDLLWFQKWQRKYLKDKTLVTVHNEKVPLGKFLQKIPQHFEGQSKIFSWNCFGGNTGRNITLPSDPLLPLRRTGQYRFKGYPYNKKGKSFPVYWNNRIYFQLSNRIICLEAETGKLLWRLSFQSPQNPMNVEHSSLMIHRGCLYAFVPNHFRKRGFKNVDKIYAIDALRGETIWSWPHREESYPRSSLSFSFSPTAVGNRLYLGANSITGAGETTSEILCFDISKDSENLSSVEEKKLVRVPDKGISDKGTPQKASLGEPGKLLWKKYLCSSINNHTSVVRSSQQTSKILGGGTSAHYGMIYFCSNFGVVGAIEASTGEVVWLNNYQEHYTEKYQLRSNSKERSLPWLNLAPVVKNGKLYITPTDEGKMYVYNCFTGALQKAYPEKRQSQGLDRILGVDENGNVYLAGMEQVISKPKTKVIALQEDGKKEILWEIFLPEAVTGQGFLTPKWIYLASAVNLYRIDKKSGKWKSTRLERMGMNPNKYPTNLFSFQNLEKQYFVLSSWRNVKIFQCQ